jgi:hypothetical protein
MYKNTPLNRMHETKQHICQVKYVKYQLDGRKRNAGFVEFLPHGRQDMNTVATMPGRIRVDLRPFGTAATGISGEPGELTESPSGTGSPLANHHKLC